MNTTSAIIQLTILREELRYAARIAQAHPAAVFDTRQARARIKALTLAIDALSALGPA